MKLVPTNQKGFRSEPPFLFATLEVFYATLLVS